MLSNTINLVKIFITVIVIVGVGGVEPVEAWHFSWFLSSEAFKANQKREKVVLHDQRDADRYRLKVMIRAERYENKLDELERQRRKQEFREWIDNCKTVFKPVKDYDDVIDLWEVSA